MKARLYKLFTWCMVLCLALPEFALAAGGGKVENIVIVADTRKFTGWEAWWTNLYNESHLYFALLTMALIPTIGVIFGVVADIIMGFIGIDLKSRELAEH
ncbi:MAG TPA: DVU0150 family protein [Humidesulfovibrio sp.]|uniref:DVU0150 family protein n=1 Tax=Humidesulfovibrio sp. TaxID=2910988 RepID=UPI002CEA815D|nr:DVU0150 family protein [Humidesulfovibrio sp.]HWR04890.1 DVU0150 family protein [Humidesulfovibrio sp.]